MLAYRTPPSLLPVAVLLAHALFWQRLVTCQQDIEQAVLEADVAGEAIV